MNTPDFNGLSLTDALNMAAGNISSFLNDNKLLYFWIPVIAFAIAVAYLGRAIYGRKKKSLENPVYIAYCCFVIALLTIAIITDPGGLFAGLNLSADLLTYLNLGAYAAFVALPGLFYLHIWTQTNYQKINAGMIVGCYVVPVILVVWSFLDYADGSFEPDVWIYLPSIPPSYMEILFIGYLIVMSIKSYLLCFNVFYQMPKHMRGSTGLLVTAMSVLSAGYIIALFANDRASFLLFTIVLVFAVERSYAGVFRASASNVIATSREFVFSNLSTMVLVLSRKGRILEWNRSRDNFVFKLLAPKYRQPFAHYRETLLKVAGGVVSSHDENIITLTHDGLEHHLLITSTPIKSGDREFGRLMEIADVTHIYSVLRFLESIAAYDQLTKLYNRNAYLDIASNAISTDSVPLLIIIGDVNNLKIVNDSVGHLAGDRLLMTISEIIRELSPPNSFIARIGGDEVALLVPHAEEDVAEKFTDSVRKKLATIRDEEYGRPAVSFGWAVARSINDDYNEIFKIADYMMYKEKKAYKEEMGVSLSGALPGHHEHAKAAFPANAPTQEPAKPPTKVFSSAPPQESAPEPIAPIPPVSDTSYASPVFDTAAASVFASAQEQAPVPAPFPEPAPFPAPTPMSFPEPTPVPAPFPVPTLESIFESVPATESTPFPAPAPAPVPAPFPAPAPEPIFEAAPAPVPTSASAPVPAPVPPPEPPAPVPPPEPVPAHVPEPEPAPVPPPETKKPFMFAPPPPEPQQSAQPESAPEPEKKNSFTFVPPK